MDFGLIALIGIGAFLLLRKKQEMPEDSKRSTIIVRTQDANFDLFEDVPTPQITELIVFYKPLLAKHYSGDDWVFQLGSTEALQKFVSDFRVKEWRYAE